MRNLCGLYICQIKRKEKRKILFFFIYLNLFQNKKFQQSEYNTLQRPTFKTITH